MTTSPSMKSPAALPDEGPTLLRDLIAGLVEIGRAHV